MYMKNEKLKKYLKKKYYKDDRKVITIAIKDESELYNTLDGMKDTLSDSVTDYLNRNVETLLPLNEIAIKVECKKKIDLDNFQKCLKVHYGTENLNYDRIRKLEERKKMILLFIALFTMISFLIEHVTLMEVRNFVVTLAIWEYIDMILGHDEEDDIKVYVSKLLEDAIIIK